MWAPWGQVPYLGCGYQKASGRELLWNHVWWSSWGEHTVLQSGHCILGFWGNLRLWWARGKGWVKQQTLGEASGLWAPPTQKQAWGFCWGIAVGCQQSCDIFVLEGEEWKQNADSSSHLSLRVLEIQASFSICNAPFLRHLFKGKSTEARKWYISLRTPQGEISATARGLVGTVPQLLLYNAFIILLPWCVLPSCIISPFFPTLTSSMMMMHLVAKASLISLQCSGKSNVLADNDSGEHPPSPSRVPGSLLSIF